MMSALNGLGERLSSLLGEPDFGLSGTPEEGPLSLTPFCSCLPYLAYCEESGLFINRGGMGFVIEAVPLVGVDSAAKKEVQNLFDELLEEGASLQCLLFADHRVDPFLKGWQEGATAGPMAAAIAEKRRAYVVEKMPYASRLFRFILSYSIPCQKESPELANKLQAKQKAALKTLNTMTFAFSWDAERLLSVLSGMISFRPEKRPLETTWNPLQALSYQFVSGGLVKVFPSGLEWDRGGPSRFRSFRAARFPASWSLDAMQLLIGDMRRESYRLHEPFFLHYGVHCPPQEAEEGRFWRRSQLIEKQGSSGALLRMIPSLAEELKECDAVRRRLDKGARFVRTQFSAGLWSPPERLEQASQALCSLFRVNGFRLEPNSYIHLPQLIAALPMTWAGYSESLNELKVLKTTITSECGCLVPLQAEWIGTKSPGMLLFGRRGQVLNWNPFDNRSGNYNVSVVGRSGSGKSVFMQELLLSGLRTGARVYILEVGRSFEKMCELLEGQQMHFSQESDICLNPFSNISNESNELGENIAMVKSIVACMASPLDKVSDYELAVIEKAVRNAWNEKKTEATITTVAEWLLEQQDQRARSLGVMLGPYCKEGVYGKHFEGRNNVSFLNPLVLVELEELKEKKDLQSVVLQVFIMSIASRAFLGDRRRPFYICIDEAWDLLRSPQSGLFIETLARRLRKYNGSLVVGTQTIDDFFATPGSKAAFENSDWLCMLSQKKSSINSLSQSGKLDLDEALKSAIESLSTRHGEFSEVMILDGDGNYSISRLILDPFSQLLYSTNAKEFAEIKEFKQKGLLTEEAINEVLKRRRS